MDQTGIYVSAHTTENIETCMLKMAPDGKERLWTALHARPWDGALSLAVDGGEVFMLGHVKTTDDRIAPPQRRKQLLYVYDAETGRLAKRTVAGTAVGEQPVMINVQWDPANDDMDASDMDAYAGVLVVAYEKRNALRWYDPQAGALLDTAAVPAPAGVAVGADGAVFVSTGDRVVKLSRANKTPTDVVTSLDKPGRLDVDHSSGDLLVYEAGTQQIKRFTTPAAAHTGQGLTAVTFEDAALTKQLGVAVAPGIDVTWSNKDPAPGGIRWTGMLLPDYGPADKGPWTVPADKEAFDGASRSGSTPCSTCPGCPASISATR